jgi:hypothetical protein
VETTTKESANEENEKRDEIRKQNKIRAKTFRERQKKGSLKVM